MIQRLQTAAQVQEFRALGVELQKQIDAAKSRSHLVKNADEFKAVIANAQLTFDNLSKMAAASMSVNRVVECTMGMTVEGLLNSIGADRDIVKAGMFGALTLTNLHVRRVTENLRSINLMLDEQERKAK